MKKITFIAILLVMIYASAKVMLCICSLTKAKEKVIEQPPFIAWTSTSIQVDKVVLSDTATVLYIKAFYHPKQWIRISGQSFLKDNNGETYALRSGIGIKPDTTDSGLSPGTRQQNCTDYIRSGKRCLRKRRSKNKQ